MLLRNVQMVLLACGLIASIQVVAQDAETVRPTQAQDSAIVPRLIKIAGVIKNEIGQPAVGAMNVTFSLYKDEEGGAPLWVETQNVTADSNGHYMILLGANSANGIPINLFMSGDARWLGVKADNYTEQRRILLMSVPYALKAGDAETLGGRPASAFMPAPAAAGAVESESNPANIESSASQGKLPGIRPPISGGGTAGYVPLWLDSNGTLGNSALFQASSKIGIGTTSPQALLDIQPSTDGVTSLLLSQQNCVTCGWSMSAQNDGDFRLFRSDKPSSILSMVYNTGNVGIGTTTPQYQLDVVNTVQAGRLVVNGGVTAGTGIKHVRGPGCTGNTCTSTATWPGTAFADTNYTVTCTPDRGTSQPEAAELMILSKTASNITVQLLGNYYCDNGRCFYDNPSMTGFECLAMHD